MKIFGHKDAEEAQEIQRQVLHAAEVHGVTPSEVVETVFDQVPGDSDDELDERGRPARHIGAWVTTVVIGVVFGVGIIALIHWANESDQAGPNAKSGLQAVAQSIAPTPAGLPALSGHYVAFSYPQAFDTVKALPEIPNSAERYIIGSTSDYRRSINVEVEANTPAITDDSGYQYRSLTPSQYQPLAVAVNSESAKVMVKMDGTERTLYWSHGGYTVIVSLSDTTGVDNLASFMQTIITTMRWVG